MQIKKLHIHNFASIIDQEISLGNYNLLIGENNSGKTNTINAIRAFYGLLAYDSSIHKPNIASTNNECWIEVCFGLTDDEMQGLDRKYHNDGKMLIIRRYFTEREINGKTLKPGYYAKLGGKPETKFRTLNDVKNGILGEVVYVPAVSKLEEQTKTSGSSPFRDAISKIIDDLVENSSAYANLKSSFSRFSENILTEETNEQLSLRKLEEELTDGMARWNVEFKLRFNPVTSETIVKNLIDHKIVDGIHNSEQKSEQYGTGMQREMIFHLIKISSKYKNNTAKSIKKDKFRPNLRVYLFEEPEAFLHPPRQVELADNLKTIASTENSQVVVSSHSSHFVSRQSDELSSIIRLHQNNGKTAYGQISDQDLTNILSDNQDINPILSSAKAKKYHPHPDDETLDMEYIKYFMWLDSRRCNMFFASKVLLVEGDTESVLINYLIRNNLVTDSQSVFVLDCIGKFNIHRFMRILDDLKVHHSVLLDDDCGKDIHLKLNKFIQKKKNSFTDCIKILNGDIETYLGISNKVEGRRKPQNILYQYRNGKIGENEMRGFINLIQKLLK